MLVIYVFFSMSIKIILFAYQILKLTSFIITWLFIRQYWSFNLDTNARTILLDLSFCSFLFGNMSVEILKRGKNGLRGIKSLSKIGKYLAMTSKFTGQCLYICIYICVQTLSFPLPFTSSSTVLLSPALLSSTSSLCHFISLLILPAHVCMHVHVHIDLSTYHLCSFLSIM